MYYFSVCCIAKNEDLYIEEWVNFHRAVGAEHCYIYDNGSTNPIKDKLEKYIKAGVVTVVDFPGPLKQMPAYQHCLQNYGHTTKWLGFVDCDEFIVPKTAESVPEILKDYEDAGGFAANWLFFGSGGLQTRPEGLVTENFIWASEKDWCLNNHVKSIVQPAKTATTGDPHWFNYKHPYYAVNEERNRVSHGIVFKCKDCWTPGAPETHTCGDVRASKLQVHHYYTKSFEEFMIRYHGGSCYVPDPTRSSPEGYNSITRVCQTENRTAARFADKVKALQIK